MTGPKHMLRAFTLVELMIVVAAVGLLAALAMPGIAKARRTAQTNRCIENQRLIFKSVQRYEIDNNATLRAIKDDGVQIRNTLLTGAYMNPRNSFDCPTSPVKDYDDYLLVYSNNDFITTRCGLEPAAHVLP